MEMHMTTINQSLGLAGGDGIGCHVYPDMPPILHIESAGFTVQVTHAGFPAMPLGATAVAERLRDAAQRFLDATADHAAREQDTAEATYADNLEVSA